MSRRRLAPSALLRACLRYLVSALTQYGLFMAGAGHVWMQIRTPQFEDTVPAEGTPPGHPERLDPGHLPSAEERLLWKQLS